MFRRRPQQQIQPRELAERSSARVLLDVREPAEWSAGHIDGAVHIPMGELGGRLGELPSDTPIVTICRSGRRSGQVAAALTERGYDVTNLDGGLQAWQRAGLPLTAADGSQGRVA